MVFFGGFGSMLPYLIYLSIVWVCVLVGMRSNIASLFRQSTTTELIVEEKSQYDFLDENTIAPFSEDLSHSDISKFYTDLTSYVICPLANESPERQSVFKHSVDRLTDQSISLRGPPNRLHFS